MIKEVTNQERDMATRVLIDRLISLRTKVDVVAEPYIELKNTMAVLADQITPILQDYTRLQRDYTLSKDGNTTLTRNYEILEAEFKKVKTELEELKKKKNGEQVEDLKKKKEGEQECHQK